MYSLPLVYTKIAKCKKGNKNKNCSGSVKNMFVPHTSCKFHSNRRKSENHESISTIQKLKTRKEMSVLKDRATPMVKYNLNVSILLFSSYLSISQYHSHVRQFI
jgi:hypothetical protein